MPEVPQPLSDDVIRVRQISYFQFSWVAADQPGEVGTHTLQLVLDQGAWEEVPTLSPIDALALQVKLASSPSAYYDVKNRTVVTPSTPVGAGLILAAAASS